MTLWTARLTPLPPYSAPPSLSSTASKAPVEAPLGTPARPTVPSSSATSTSRVGLPRESRICLAWIASMEATADSLPQCVERPYRVEPYLRARPQSNVRTQLLVEPNGAVVLGARTTPGQTPKHPGSAGVRKSPQCSLDVHRVYQDQKSRIMCTHDGVWRLHAPFAGALAGQSFLASGGAVMATGDSSEVAVQPELDRRQATSLVSDALTAVIPDLRVEALDERQELYTDLGLDSLGFVRLLIELEGKLGVQLGG